MSWSRFAPRTLASKFLWILVLGALLPLGLVGTWLTRAADRSGVALLREQLGSAADGLEASANEQWTLRLGDLHLLASNSSANAAVSTPSTLTRPDSTYLHELELSVAATIPSFSYQDASGVERWSFVAAVPVETIAPGNGGTRAVARPSSVVVPIELPIVSEDGRVVGKLVARVLVASVFPGDAVKGLVSGTTLSIANASGTIVQSAPKPANVFAPVAPVGWEVAMRSITDSPLRLALAAPIGPYVKPFARAARIGIGLLLLAGVVALIISVLFTRRVTRSLEQLAAAAGAVAAGDLQRMVPAGGNDEVGDVAASFNAMTESLRKTLGELAQQRALAAVGEFAAGLSHEVRNSLTAIRVDLQHAALHLPADNEGTPLVSRTLDTVRRLDSTVTGALRVARSGQYQPSRIDLVFVLKHAMRGAEPSFNERGAILKPLEHEEPVELDGDPSALEQLFLNLLFNAAQSLERGGSARIDVATIDGSVIVKVIDVGSGIAADELSADGMPLRSTTRDGTGLGLPIARRIAMAHGGDLRVESVSRVGTTVTVRFPRAMS